MPFSYDLKLVRYTIHFKPQLPSQWRNLLLRDGSPTMDVAASV